MIKLVSVEAEGAHQSIRRARQKGMDAIKKAFKSASADDKKRTEKEVKRCDIGAMTVSLTPCCNALHCRLIFAQPQYRCLSRWRPLACIQSPILGICIGYRSDQQALGCPHCACTGAPLRRVFVRRDGVFV
jgi:hypothetical protein